MKKVYITKVLKGQEPAHAIGMLDVASKKLYIPFVSKKGMSIIEEVEIDYLTKQSDGSYRCEVIVVTTDDRHFMNVYFVNPLDKEVK